MTPAPADNWIVHPSRSRKETQEQSTLPSDVAVAREASKDTAHSWRKLSIGSSAGAKPRKGRLTCAPLC